MAKIKAEMWDKMQLILRDFYDGTMHSAFYYESELDIDALKKVYEHFLRQVPILHSTFHNNPIKSYWEIHDEYSVDDFFSVVETDNPNEELEKFVTHKVDEKGNQQFFARVIRSNGKDILSVIVNHMCFDGGDLKYFNNTTAKLYNELKTTGKFASEVKTGSRASTQVYDAMSDEDKYNATHLDKNVSAVKNKCAFPYAENDGTEHNRIVKEKISAEQFVAVKAKGKSQNASVNDVFLAAYIKALYTVCGLDTKEKMNLSCMCDLRRYMKDKQTYGLTNLTGFMPCSVENVGDTFEGVLAQVCKQTAAQKQDKYLGLSSIPLLNLAFTIFPDALARFCIRIGFKNPIFGMSNIGIIEPDKMTLGGVRLEDAWYTGAVKYKPYIQLAMTTFNNEITMTVAIRGNDKDAKAAQNLLDEIKAVLAKYAA